MEKMEKDKIIVFVTASSMEEAKEISRQTVEHRLAACVSILEGLRSTYRWKNEICEESEVLLIIKTCKGCFKDLSTLVMELHSYEVPEIISVDISDGLPSYLNWITEETLGNV